MAARDDVDLLETEAAYRGYVRVEKLRLRHRQFAGGMGGVLQREIVQRGDAVAVLPYDPVRDEVVLIEQFRVGPYARGDDNPWLIEAVAGIIEDGEAPDEVAVRETDEEAGLAISDLTPILAFYPSPGLISEHIQVYVARVDASRAGGIHGLDHEGEDIRVMAWPFETAMAALREGRITASTAVVSLQWLALNREELRRRWRDGDG